MLWVRLPLRARSTTLCHKVCQWLATGQWFSLDLGPMVSSTNETDRHDILEILLKVALNTIKQTNIWLVTVSGQVALKMGPPSWHQKKYFLIFCFFNKRQLIIRTSLNFDYALNFDQNNVLGINTRLPIYVTGTWQTMKSVQNLPFQ